MAEANDAGGQASRGIAEFLDPVDAELSAGPHGNSRLFPLRSQDVFTMTFGGSHPLGDCLLRRALTACQILAHREEDVPVIERTLTGAFLGERIDVVEEVLRDHFAGIIFGHFCEGGVQGESVETALRSLVIDEVE